MLFSLQGGNYPVKCQDVIIYQLFVIIISTVSYLVNNIFSHVDNFVFLIIFCIFTNTKGGKGNHTSHKSQNHNKEFQYNEKESPYNIIPY